MECGRWLAFAMGETPARSGWRVAARRAARAWRMSLKRETERERARHASEINQSGHTPTYKSEAPRHLYRPRWYP